MVKISKILIILIQNHLMQPPPAPMFSPKPFMVPCTETLTCSQFSELIEWLKKNHPDRQTLIDYLEKCCSMSKSMSMLDIKSIFVFVFNNNHDFFCKFVKYVFQNIFKLTFTEEIHFPFTFTFEGDFVSVEISFQKLGSGLLTENDIHIVCSLKVGGIFEQFRIVRCIGRGTFGCVYEGVDMVTREHFAIKMQDRVSHNKEVQKLIAVRGCSPYVVLMHSYSTLFSVFDQEYGCIVLPYFSSGTLKDHFTKVGMNDIAMIMIFLDLLRALHSIHQVGVIHCDVKPYNIVMNIVDGVVIPIMIDFGLAHHLPIGKSFGRCSQELYSMWWRDFINWLIAATRAPSGYQFSPYSDLMALFLTMLDVASRGQYNGHRIFSIFRNGDYFNSDSQERIDEAIDNVFHDNEMIANFFKKYLNITTFMISNEQMRENPDSKVTIVADAIRDLETLLAVSQESDARCQEQQITPLRPRRGIDPELQELQELQKLLSIEEEDEEEESHRTEEEDEEEESHRTDDEEEEESHQTDDEEEESP